jgi:hypothetical protein
MDKSKGKPILWQRCQIQFWLHWISSAWSTRKCRFSEDNGENGDGIYLKGQCWIYASVNWSMTDSGINIRWFKVVVSEQNSSESETKGWGCRSEIECLPSTHKVLSLIPSTTRKRIEPAGRHSCYFLITLVSSFHFLIRIKMDPVSVIYLLGMANFQ